MFDVYFAASNYLIVTKAIARKHGVSEKSLAAREHEILSTVTKHFLSALDRKEFTVLPGIPELLRELKLKGVALALYTGDSEAAIDAILKKAGLNGYFDPDLRAFGSRDPPVSSRKTLLEEVLEKSRQKHGEIPKIFLFDDSEKGIAAGNELGLVTIGVETGPEGENVANARYVFPDFSDYQRVLEIVLKE